MTLTVAQAEQVARVIWKRAPGILDRAKPVKALRRARLLVQLAQGREWRARETGENGAMIYRLAVIASGKLAPSLPDMEEVLHMWRERTLQRNDRDHLANLNVALALLDESRSMPEFLAKLKERL